MASTYEFFLLDDAGRRICTLTGFYYFSYSRSINGLGVLEMGFQYDVFKRQVFPLFQVDRRVDVWRSPATGIPMRREQVYLMRMWEIKTREEDGVDIVTLRFRDPKDLLNRRFVIQAAGTSYTRKTDAIDDMMKAIVREQMLFGSALDVDGVLAPERAWPEGEFMVQDDLSLGPSVTQTFAERNVRDILNGLRELSFQKADENPANNKIYFDVVPFELRGSIEYILDEANPADAILDEAGNPLIDESSSSFANASGFRFETFAGLRGMDRTSGLVFSKENNNLKGPYYSKSHLEEATSAIVKGFGRGDSRVWDSVDAEDVNASRWNRIETFVDASTEPDQANLADYAYEPLNKAKAKENFDGVFLSTPGSADTPRSLYGIDWDLGDLLPVEYAGMRRNVEVTIVYVAMDENSVETITGRNDINASDQ